MADTIFMIHGMWGGPWYWENYKRLFEAEGYRCIATTLPFHDMEPQEIPDPRLGSTSLVDYADALELEIKQLDEKPIIMGHSMGGLLGQMLASRGLAKALVMLTPAAPSGIPAFTPSVIRSFWSIQTTWAFWKKPVRQTFKEAAYAMLHLLPVKEQKEAYGRFVYESGRAVFEVGCWFMDTRGSSRVDASKVTCPVLVVGGTLDRITPARVVRRVAKKYGAAYKEFENHAHLVVAEPGWEEVAEYVSGWLKSGRKQNT